MAARTAPWLILGALLAVLAALLAAPSLARPRTASGTVSTPTGPADGARVRFRGDSRQTLTDPNGRFSLTSERRPGDRLTAWLEGYFIAGTDASSGPADLRLRPLPAEDNEGYEWVDPTPGGERNCGTCHEEVYREWRDSGHARSLTGRHFRNLFDGSDWHGRPDRGWSLLAEHPDGAGVCTACHGPTVRFTDPAYFDPRAAKGVAAEGVHCDYCHKVSGTAGEVGVTHGRFGLKLLRPEEGQLFFGPLDDVDRGEDAHLALYSRSRYCAPCHEGTVFGVRVYGTYSEWLDSPARRRGVECQGCHMTPTGRMSNVAPGHGGVERDPKSLSNHRFVAGSLTDMLRGCVRLDVTTTRTGDGVTAEVTVEAKDAGHRVPTGFVDRNVALVVEARDAGGAELAVAEGPRLPDWAGPDVRGKGGKLYARQLKDFDGRHPAPFWRADPDAEDTRLRPDEPDRLRFRFPATAGELRVRLLYRRFWPDVAATKGWPDNEVVIAERRLQVR